MTSKYRRNGSVASGIAIAFLLSGIASLVYSFFFGNAILAFVGLSLTFWGALFLFIKPVDYVKGILLKNGSISSYLIIESAIRDFEGAVKGYYLPPFSKEVILSEGFAGLRDSVVYVSAKEYPDLPLANEMVRSGFMFGSSNGLLFTPPGWGLLNEIEGELKKDFTSIPLSEVPGILIRYIREGFNLAVDLEIELSGNQVQMKISDSLYMDFYSAENNLKSVSVLGCPIVSAAACAFAKASGKAVAIQNYLKSPDNSTMEVWLNILQG